MDALHDLHRPGVAGCRRPARGRQTASLIVPRTLKGLLEPAHVPVPTQLATHLPVGAYLEETEPAVQRDRGVVGQRDAGIRAMDVLATQRLEQRGVERS